MHAVVALAVLKLALKLELGPEYDTNANRAEVIAGGTVNSDAPTGSALLRTTARLGLSYRHGINELRLSGGLGAKVFFNPDVSDQDVLVGQLAVEDRVRVARAVDLGVSADYYDAGQLDVTPPCAADGCMRRRDFRTGQALVRASFLDEPGDLTIAAGYRGFQYKPDETFDFQALQVHVGATAHPRPGPPTAEHEIDINVAYHLERRWFSGNSEYRLPHDPMCEVSPAMPGCILPDLTQKRTDWFHEASVEVSWLRWFLLSVGYAVQLNQSSSFGQSLLRNLFTLKAAVRLPWQIYATLKAQLLVTAYLDPVLLDRNVNSQTFISIEDENRNAVIVDLERPIGKTGVAVLARYSLYTNELSSSPVSFLRQVVYLGVSYRLSR